LPRCRAFREEEYTRRRWPQACWARSPSIMYHTGPPPEPVGVILALQTPRRGKAGLISPRFCCPLSKRATGSSARRASSSSLPSTTRRVEHSRRQIELCGRPTSTRRSLEAAPCRSPEEICQLACAGVDSELPVGGARRKGGSCARRRVALHSFCGNCTSASASGGQHSTETGWRPLLSERLCRRRRHGRFGGRRGARRHSSG